MLRQGVQRGEGGEGGEVEEPIEERDDANLRWGGEKRWERGGGGMG